MAAKKADKSDAITGGRQCIWMEAGVINYKLCPYNYACNLCAFDKSMKASTLKRAEARKVAWTERLRELNGPEKYCRHMLQGLVSYKVCPHNYDCGTCSYDQMIQDTIGDAMPPDLRQVAGFDLPLTYHFHRKHAWVNVEYSGKCRVGYDDFSTHLLGRGHEFVMPKVGQRVAQGEPFMAVKAADDEFELDAPIDGVVTAVNPLQQFGDELKPYEEGWIAFVEPGRKMPANLKKLYYADKAVEWLGESTDKLVEELTPGGQAIAADGGIIVPELYDSLTTDVRSNLIKKVVLGG